MPPPSLRGTSGASARQGPPSLCETSAASAGGRPAFTPPTGVGAAGCVGRSGVTMYTRLTRGVHVTQPFIGLVLLLLAPALAAAQQPRPEPAVVTIGEGLVQAVPDRAFVNITAESRAG